MMSFQVYQQWEYVSGGKSLLYSCYPCWVFSNKDVRLISHCGGAGELDKTTLKVPSDSHDSMILCVVTLKLNLIPLLYIYIYK